MGCPGTCFSHYPWGRLRKRIDVVRRGLVGDSGGKGMVGPDNLGRLFQP